MRRLHKLESRKGRIKEAARDKRDSLATQFSKAKMPAVGRSSVGSGRSNTGCGGHVGLPQEDGRVRKDERGGDYGAGRHDLSNANVGSPGDFRKRRSSVRNLIKGLRK